MDRCKGCFSRPSVSGGSRALDYDDVHDRHCGNNNNDNNNNNEDGRL